MHCTKFLVKSTCFSKLYKITALPSVPSLNAWYCINSTNRQITTNKLSTFLIKFLMVSTTRCHKGKSGKICKALKSYHRNTMFSMVNPPCTWCRLSHRVNNAKYPKYCSGKGVHRTDVQFFSVCDLRLWSFWFWTSIKGIFWFSWFVVGLQPIALRPVVVFLHCSWLM